MGRYRFSTFYLENSQQNFIDFFDFVVDPEWLASNDEQARALRQVDRKKKNLVWRVLHRVTSVERPALSGFGADPRPLLAAGTAEPGVADQLKTLRAENLELKNKLDAILVAIKTKTAAAGA